MNERGPLNNGNSNNGSNNNNNKNGQTILWFILAALVVLFVMSTITNRINNYSSKNISYSDFKQMVKEDKVESVVITTRELEITPKKSENKGLIKTTYYTVNLGDENLYAFLDAHDVDYKGKNSSMMDSVLSMVFSFILPLVVVWLLIGFAMRRMGGGSGLVGVVSSQDAESAAAGHSHNQQNGNEQLVEFAFHKNTLHDFYFVKFPLCRDRCSHRPAGGCKHPPLQTNADIYAFLILNAVNLRPPPL